MSTLVATTIDDDAEDEDEVREIPLPNVKETVLQKVIEYCEHYKEEPMTPIQTPLKSSKLSDLVQPWYCQFTEVEQQLLFEMVTAANFMDVKPLLDLTCLAVSILIKVSKKIRICLKSMLRKKEVVDSHSAACASFSFICNVHTSQFCSTSFQ